MFKAFTSKPVTHMALQLTADISVCSEPGQEKTFAASVPIYKDMNRVIYFKAHEEPKVGDWLVRQKGSDTYHVPDAIFREHNIVPEGILST